MLFGLTSLLLAIFGAYLILSLLRHVGSWRQRRSVQILALMLPLVSLGLGLGGLLHFIGQACLSRAPFWDALLGVTLPLGMALVMLGAFGLGLLRVILMARNVAHSAVPAGPQLQTLADDLARRLGAARPRVLLRPAHQPLAFTSGVVQSTVLLSTWMVEHLDQHELEAVLAHELEHIARRDYLVICLATILRDAFFYLPTSRVVFRQLQQEKELACDDLAVGVTQRPLALASALAKVWQHAIEGAGFAQCSTAQLLTGSIASMNGRIERLLATPKPAAPPACPHRQVLSISLFPLIGLLVLQAVNVALILAFMGCGPSLLLGKLL
jgi:Zn-dependent protease with chaperone function